jgi:hypothetical protein
MSESDYRADSDTVFSYYAAYLQFFHREVDTLGPQMAVKKYLLSEEAVSQRSHVHAAPG